MKTVLILVFFWASAMLGYGQELILDRTETVDGKLKVYPVKKWKPAMY